MNTASPRAEILTDASVAAGAAPAASGDEIARVTRRLDLMSGLLAAGTLAVLEMGPALAKKGFRASDFEVALLTSGQSLGLILSFLTAHIARDRPSVPLVFRLQFAASLCLVLVFFLDPGTALPFVILHALARIAWSMAIPARVVVYRTNLPEAVRGAIIGRIRQLQLFLTTAFALVLSTLLDWNLGAQELVEVLGPCPVAADHMVRYAIPAVAAFGLLGSLIYRRIPDTGPAEKTAGPNGNGLHALLETFGEFRRVWRRDKAFRRYESFFFLFGFANIMSIPLTQIHAVDRLGANYFDLAMINVIIVQGLMGLTMAAWGRLVDRYPPQTLRGILNLIFSIDFLALALAPTIGWVYGGRVFRGIALGGGTLVWMLGPLYFAREARNAPVYTGIHSVLTGIRWGVAPFTGVLLKEQFGSDSRPIFFLGFVVLVVTGIGMLLEPSLREASRASAGAEKPARNPPARD